MADTEFIDLADPSHPRVPLNKDQADLLLTLLKLDFSMRIGGAVKNGGMGDPLEVMDLFEIPAYLELCMAFSHILFKVYTGEATNIPCPEPLAYYIRNVLSAKTINDPKLAVTAQSERLYHLVQQLKPGILSAISGEATGVTQFMVKGPARA